MKGQIVCYQYWYWNKKGEEWNHFKEASKIWNGQEIKFASYDHWHFGSHVPIAAWRIKNTNQQQ